MADDGLASELQNSGFATLGKVADPANSVAAVKSAGDSLGNIGKKIQDFYKKSISQEKKAEPGMAPGSFAKFKTQYQKDHKGE